jgi:hypothetical protein
LPGSILPRIGDQLFTQILVEFAFRDQMHQSPFVIQLDRVTTAAHFRLS